MSTKRPHDSIEGTDPPKAVLSKKSKKNSNNSKARQHQNAFIDATFGQKYFFTGQGTQTSVPKDEELDFEDDSEAMAYLNSVRHQASGIPHLLVALKVHHGPQLPVDFVPTALETDAGEDEYPEGAYADDEDAYDDDDEGYDYYNDPDGYYEDGAYTAAPDIPPPESPTLNPKTILVDSYYASILSRFNNLRATLHTKPPTDFISALPKSHSPFVGNFGPRSATFAIWNKRLSEQDPRPIQLAAMDRDAPLRVLRVLLGGKFLKPGLRVSKRTSRWIWGLLARIPDKGELQHTDIAWIRDLGRRAVLMARGLVEREALEELVEADVGPVAIAEMVVNDNDDALLLGERTDTEVEQTDEPVQEPEIHEASEPLVKPVAEPEEDPEEGEAMEMSDEEGEIQDDAPVETLEQAKARLLAKLSDTTTEENKEEESVIEEDAPQEERPDDEESPVEDEEDCINLWHTVNMILTIAGEVYGQRDLLEFRDPFPSI